MSVRILHAADIHLGTSFRSRPEIGRQLQEALRRSFDDMATAAIDRCVHAVLLAGDLFETPATRDLSLTLRSSVQATLERLNKAKIAVFIAPGNHDPITPGSLYRQWSWPDNVTFFDSIEPRAVQLIDTQPPITIHGVGHTNSKVGANLVERFRTGEDGRFHVAVIHCNVQDRMRDERHENYAPCLTGDFAGRGIHYWALGHIHAPALVVHQTHPSLMAVYPGCLCGLGFGDLGPRGCTLITIADDFSIQHEFLPIGRVQWEDCDIRAEPEDDVDAILARIRRHIESLDLGARSCCLRIRLVGRCRAYGSHDPSQWDEHAGELRDEHGFIDVSIEPRLQPMIDRDAYADRPHILGELVRLCREKTTPNGTVSAEALNDILGDELLRRTESDQPNMDESQQADYRKQVLNEAMDILLEEFTTRRD